MVSEMWLTIAGVVLGVIGVLSTLAAWMFPDFRHWLLPKFGVSPNLFEPEKPIKTESKTEDAIAPEPQQSGKLQIKSWTLDQVWGKFVETKHLDRVAHFYHEATSLFQDGSFPTNLDGSTQKQIGDAIERWVAHAFSTIEDAYPGTGQPDCRDNTVTRLHLLAWQKLPEGWVIEFKFDEGLDNCCVTAFSEVKEWIQRRRLEEPN